MQVRTTLELLLGAQDTTLQAGNQVDRVQGAQPRPAGVPLNAGTEVQQRLGGRHGIEGTEQQGTVLIIGDAINVQGRYQLTSQTPGAMTVNPSTCAI